MVEEDSGRLGEEEGKTPWEGFLEKSAAGLGGGRDWVVVAAASAAFRFLTAGDPS